MRYGVGEIAKICGGTLIGRSDGAVSSVVTDSRTFSIGGESLFVAIKGRNMDGHAYVNKLYSRGVRAFLIERDISTDGYSDASFIRVESSVDGLQRLAAHYRAQFKGVVVGVTGSNGKTVVKEWVAELMPENVKLFRSPKSYNSQIGVPLSLLMLRGDEQVAVIEVGISEVGEMERLERIVKPDLGVITMIGDAHQENFDSIEQKVEQKLKLFVDCPRIIYNSDYREVRELLERDFSDRELIDSADEDMEGFGFHDKASLDNGRMALMICKALGQSEMEVRARLKGVRPVAMRLELKEGLYDSIIINDTYNSDINSLAIAIDYLDSVASGREKYVILSDILQSGYKEQELYSRVGELLKQGGVSGVVGIGERIRNYAHCFDIESVFFASTDAFLANMSYEDIEGRAILIKGSRASQFEKLSHALARKSHTTTLEVDLDAIVFNLNIHRALLEPGVRSMAMVKASAYGHGGYEVANALQHAGVHYLGVAFTDEGVTLRERGISIPIVVLNADSNSYDMMIINGLEPEIYNFSSLDGFIDTAKRYGERNYPIHIKVDTGMHRLGFVGGELEQLAERLSRASDWVKVATVFSHLAASDEAKHDEFTREQIDKFNAFYDILTARLGYKPLRHIANSAAAERMPQSQMDMVRLGIGLYGVGDDLVRKLKPVSRLKTRIVAIKELDPTQSVGYGRKGVLGRVSRIATIPVGYADGLRRALGMGAWQVEVNGYGAPIVGNVCMDTCMVDVTDIDCKEGDEVVIYGGDEGWSIKRMARVLNTIPYDVMTSVAARVKRVYIKE